MKIFIKKFILLFFVCSLSIILLGCEEQSDNENLDIFIEKFNIVHPNGYTADSKWYHFNYKTSELDVADNIYKTKIFSGDAELKIDNSFNAVTSVMQMNIDTKKTQDGAILMRTLDEIKFKSGDFFKECKSFYVSGEFKYSETYRATKVYLCELLFDFNIDILNPSTINGEDRLKYFVSDTILRVNYYSGKKIVEIDENTYQEIQISETYTFNRDMIILSAGHTEIIKTYENNKFIKEYNKYNQISFTTSYNIEVPIVADEILDLDEKITFSFYK